MNCLFLEGEKQTGKSTFLQKMLWSNKKELTGFYVVRKVTNQGQIAGFELHSAASMDGIVTSDAPLQEECCFLRKEAGKMIYQERVFQTRGRQLLRQAQRQPKRLVLLDEIGGVELMEPKVFPLLLELLQSQQKVIGVFKSDDNFSHQNLPTNLREKITQRRAIIKKIIKKRNENSVLLDWKEYNQDRVQKQIVDFLN